MLGCISKQYWFRKCLRKLDVSAWAAKLKVSLRYKRKLGVSLSAGLAVESRLQPMTYASFGSRSPRMNATEFPPSHGTAPARMALFRACISQFEKFFLKVHINITDALLTQSDGKTWNKFTDAWL